MNNIKWKDGAVCYINGRQRNHESIWINGVFDDEVGIDDFDDLQLNEPRTGDYIEKSELDTEQKYNDVVAVFGLFGFEWGRGALKGYCHFRNSRAHNLSVNKHGIFHSLEFAAHLKRKLTYNQLMAIGKLKRLIDECDRSKGGNAGVGNLACGDNGKEILKQTDALDVKRKSEYCGCLKVDLNDVTTLNPCAGGFNVGYKCEKSAPKSGPKTTPEVSTDKKHKPIVAQVMIDLTERMEVGIKEYGEALRPNNGRDALQDAYEEALDLACYLKQAIIERDSK